MLGVDWKCVWRGSAPRSVFAEGVVKAGCLDDALGGHDPPCAGPHPDVLLMRIKPLIRRALLLAVASVACAAVATATAAGPPIQPRLTKALTGPSLSLGRTAALAVDASTGDVIYAHNSSLPVAPASNEKIPV